MIAQVFLKIPPGRTGAGLSDDPANPLIESFHGKSSGATEGEFPHKGSTAQPRQLAGSHPESLGQLRVLRYGDSAVLCRHPPKCNTAGVTPWVLTVAAAGPSRPHAQQCDMRK